jgi:delta-aminolevulinic acid dehydratase/porphobilinogen synthase
MNLVMAVGKDAMRTPSNDSVQYVIPFPVIGDSSQAYRVTSTDDPDRLVTYTVIFMKKNVFEKIIMTGTTTDSELLKNIALEAADKIR